MPRPPNVDIDEFTLVLSLIDKDIGADWILKSEEILKEFLELSRLEQMFGKLVHTSSGLPKGYTSGLMVDEQLWYLKIAWHEEFPKMGVCVRFSAQAWAAYQTWYNDLFQEEIHLAKFISMVQSKVYNLHLSRVDLTADYFDWTDPIIPNVWLSPDAIYRKLLNGEYIVRARVVQGNNSKWVKAVRSTSAIDKDGEYSTFYLGSKTSSIFLRCYDKRTEQISNNGSRAAEALSCRSWVRFEMVMRYDYARQFTAYLLEINTLEELQAFIAKCIMEKYSF